MRRSPRRPLILRRRKLPFQQNDSQAAEPQKQSAASDSPKPAVSASSQCFPDGIRILDHPSLSDTQVVVIPKTADLQTVIGALTAKGKESGIRGPNKFILLGANGSLDNESICQPAAEGDDASTRNTAGKQVKEEAVYSPEATPFTRIKTLNKDLDCGPLDDSLTNIQWLGRMSTHAFGQDLSKKPDKENQSSNCQSSQTQNTQINAEDAQQPISERPPYSYMAMIQFAINSRKDRRMTLKEIYTWIEDHFPYFRQVAKPGWKNSIRHNLSLHDMFIRETSEDGKISFWTIQPEANRCLTLDQVYKPESDPVNASVPVPLLLCPQQQQKRISPDSQKIPTGSERKMKPLLPRTESYLIPIQLPITSSIYLPPLSAPSRSQKKHNSSRGCKRVRIAPKVTQSDVPAMSASMLSQKSNDIKVKEESADVSVKCETPKSVLKRPASNSRRKQRLIHSQQEEPVLLCPDNTFFDSGVASDVTLQDMQETELEESRHKQFSPDRESTFKTPIKSSSHLISSTPSKPPSYVLPEPWIVTPVGKESHSILDFSPIRTPGGPAVTPRHDYTTFSLNNTPFKDLPLFSSPRELLTSTASKVTGPIESPFQCLKGSCSRELLQAGGAAATNRSITEGLVLDTMNDSLSKILVDISFSALDDEDLGTANISWSEFMPQFM